MDYPKTKVYFDGSHFIGIPPEKQIWKQRKNNKKKVKNETEEKVKELYKSETGTKKEKVEKVVEQLNKEINNKEKTTELVKNVLEKEKRNKTVRLTRLMRKLGLQQWTHFCTFTYDGNKLTEEEFRNKLLTCLRHLSHRKGWKYIGVFERSPELKRLHFHGIFVIKEMVGEIIETKDYSTKNHQMQVAHQNTYFLERFGRNDFKPIINNTTNKRMKDLENQIEELERQILVEKSKTMQKLSKEDIKEYYIQALKLEPKLLIDYLIQEIKVFEDKIKVTFNSPIKTSPDKNQGFFIFSFLSKLQQYIQNKEQPKMLDIEIKVYI